MDTSTRAFKIGLYLEHLEEAAFLYEQCNALRKDPKLPWQDLAPFEDRLEAHLDALVIGAGLATEICRKRALEGEAGELFAAVCVFCRHADSDSLAIVFRALDEGEVAKVTAVEDALMRELPEKWADYCGQGIARQGLLARVLTNVAGYRRLDLAQHIRPSGEASLPDAIAAARALGRIGDAQAVPRLAELMRRPEPALRQAALLAMLRLGSSEALKPCHLLAQRERWPHMPMALGASRAVIEVLLPTLESGQLEPAQAGETLIALGLLGELRAVRGLQQALQHEVLAESAAWALQLITGADLFEETFVADEVVEDELFENELKLWREKGQAPLRPDGKPFGSQVVKLSTSPEAWRNWLSANASRFDAALRYRNGEPCTPRALFSNLLDGRLPRSVRLWVGEELRIRYDCNFPFEVDMPVRQQLRALRGVSRWLQQNESHFAAGTWYFAGQALV